MKIDKQFYDQWSFPNARNAIGRKHITFQKPVGGGLF